MKIEKLLFQVAQLSAADQMEFIDKVRPVCSSDEIVALQIGIAYFRQLQQPELKNAIQTALAKDLYNYFQMN